MKIEIEIELLPKSLLAAAETLNAFVKFPLPALPFVTHDLKWESQRVGQVRFPKRVSLPCWDFFGFSDQARFRVFLTMGNQGEVSG